MSYGFTSSNWYMTILKRDGDRHTQKRRRWGRRRRSEGEEEEEKMKKIGNWHMYYQASE